MNNSPKQHKYIFDDGKPLGYYKRKLSRNILLDMLRKLGEDKCAKCGMLIESEEEMSLGHQISWRNKGNPELSKKLFWDLNNIKIEHKCCNLPDSPTNKNGFRGISKHVYENTGNTLYCAEISVKNKPIKLGYSKDPVVVAKYYDLGIMKYRNGKGVLNFEELREEYVKILEKDSDIV